MNEFLQSLGLLNNFLGQEIQRTKQERIQAMQGAVATSIADTFLQLPQNATEEQLKGALVQSTKMAALTNTLKENQPLISSYYKDYEQSMIRQQKLASDKALTDALAPDAQVAGVSTSGLGGDDLQKLLSYKQSQFKSNEGKNAEGQAVLRTLKTGPNGQSSIMSELITNPMTTKQELENKLAQTGAEAQVRGQIQQGFERANIFLRHSLDQNDLKPTTYNTTEGVPLEYSATTGYAYRSLDANNKQVLIPYQGTVVPRTDPNLSKIREINAGIAQTKQSKMILNENQKIVEGQGQALAQEILNSGIGSQFGFKDLSSTNDPKYVRQKLGQMVRQYGVKGIMEQLASVKGGPYIEGTNTYSQMINSLNAFQTNEKALTKQEADFLKGTGAVNPNEVSSRGLAFKRFGFNEQQYGDLYKEVSKTMNNPASNGFKAIQEYAQKYFGKKITSMEDIDNIQDWNQKMQLYNWTRKFF